MMDKPEVETLPAGASASIALAFLEQLAARYEGDDIRILCRVSTNAGWVKRRRGRGLIAREALERLKALIASEEPSTAS